MTKSSAHRRACIAAGVLVLAALLAGHTAGAVSLAVCTTDSTPDQIIQSAPCGIYGVVQTRTEAGGPIFVRFMTHTPSGAPKGIVILLPGGAGGAGLSGTPGSAPLAANNNFLVRTAQLQAESGLLAITSGRPLFNDDTNTPEGVVVYFDYRITPRHAFDIVSILNTVIASNPGAYRNLPVFLAGTSASTVAAMAQAALVSAVALSSPVTGGVPGPGALFIGNTYYLQLVPANIPAPVHVMWHEDDVCPGTLPQNAEVIYQQFRNAGVKSEADEIRGGFTLAGTGDPPITDCEGLAFHGFLGVENKAVKEITKLFDDVLGDLRRRAPGNRKPVVAQGVMSGGVVMLDLAILASDPDGDAVTFSLPYTTSNRGATLTLGGTIVTYAPGGGSALPDGFVFIASDGKGGLTPGIVTVLP